MGSMDFAAQYQQSPVPEEGNLIRWKWFNRYDEEPHKDPNDRIIVSWDTALSSKDLSSYSAGIVLHVKGPDFYVLDVFRAQLEYPDLRRKVIEVHNRWRYASNRYSLVVENKGSGMSLIQDLQREYQIRAVSIDPSADKIMRLTAQTAKIEAGHVFLPRSAHWLGEFQKELMAFPRGRTDDQVDALSQGLAFVSDKASFQGGWGTIKGLW
jgi:predicted phage terminase large subunit-like protein